MSFNSNDDFKYQSILDIAMQVLNGLDVIKANRKKGKLIIGGFLPPMDLGFVSEKTIPFFLARFTEFQFQNLLKIFYRLNQVGMLKRIITFWDDRRHFFDQINSSSQTTINAQAVTNALADLNTVAENSKFYLDSCVQTRIAYGAYLKYKEYFDLLIGGVEGNYCLHFAKFYERIGLGKKVFYFEKPYGDENSQNVLELLIKEIERYFKTIETMTNETIDVKKFKERLKLMNDVRKIGALIQTRYYNKGYVPLHAAGAALVSGAYVDFLCNINYFHERMRLMVHEFETNIKKGIMKNYKKEGIPRILIAGSPGFEPALPSILQKNGGCLLYLDIFANTKIYSLVNLTGDLIENYAKFLMRINFKLGPEDLIDYWMDKAKQVDADGIIFNEVWGCRFITPSFKLFRDRVRDELEIPVVGVNLHNLGENLGQLDTRIGAFMELIR